ncbi:MAG: hypothetical protein IKW45_04845 [Clostridia bacterium]|nr:hypothetical protein [Clostridia bacterium]
MTKTIRESKDAYVTFAALKLIEALYLQGEIKSHVYENILRDNSKVVDTTKFAHIS